MSYGNTFSFGELGVHYTDMGMVDDLDTAYDESGANLDVYMKSDFGFWIFDDTYVGAMDLTGDMKLRADFYSHMDAGGADVVYGWGLNMDMADEGFMHQTATLGVEANMTDWATLRAGYTWNHVLSADDKETTAFSAASCTGANGSSVVAADTGACTAADANNVWADEVAQVITPQNTGESIGAFAWGLGFNWGGLTADFTVSSTLLQDPVGTITGGRDAGSLTDHGITLTYSF